MAELEADVTKEQNKSRVAQRRLNRMAGISDRLATQLELLVQQTDCHSSSSQVLHSLAVDARELCGMAGAEHVFTNNSVVSTSDKDMNKACLSMQ